jgi:phenylalanyl-tRNA synthetase beta chain
MTSACSNWARRIKGKEENYLETDHLSLYVTGQEQETNWKEKSRPVDIFYMKGLCSRVLRLVGVNNFSFEIASREKMRISIDVFHHKKIIATVGSVDHQTLSRFDIRQPVYFVDLYWQDILGLIRNLQVDVAELPKQLPVHRDLAMIVERSTAYGTVEKTIHTVGLDKLKRVQLLIYLKVIN